MDLERYCWARQFAFAPRQQRTLIAQALIGGHGFDSLTELRKTRADFSRTQQLYECDLHQDIQALVLGDAYYPEQLKRIPDAPLLIYYRGDIRRLAHENSSLSIVGTRKPTQEYRTWSENFAKEVAQLGLIIISGLALGVDGAAHRGAISVEGVTFAYVANGLDTVYPPQHQELASEIVNQGGALLSQFPSGTKPLAYNFLNRNRLIAAHSIAVLVVQAGARSGSLSTARHALNLGREVLAVPGPVSDARFAGSNKLIQTGAGCVLEVKDIFELLPNLERSGNEPLTENRLNKGIISEKQYLEMAGISTERAKLELNRRELLGEIKLHVNGKIEVL